MILEEFERSRLTYQHNHDDFKRLMAKEPQLHSIAKEFPEATLEHFVLFLHDQPSGGVSIGYFKNQNRSETRNLFARIDLVVVPEEFRGLGIAKVLVTGALLQIIRAFPQSLYSISCLAGHKAIEHILRHGGFTIDPRPEHHFSHCSLALENPQEMDAKFTDLLHKSIQQANYRIRQSPLFTPGP